MRSHHDMGGLPADLIARGEHDLTFWEKRVDGLTLVLLAGKVLRIDEFRRAIEQLPPQTYDSVSYYERWIWSIASVLQEHGVLTADELGRKMAEVEARAGIT